MEYNNKKRCIEASIFNYNNKKYRSEDDKINEHKLIETEVDPIICECEICDCGFTNHNAFNEHMACIHQVEKFRRQLFKSADKSADMSDIDRVNDNKHIMQNENPYFNTEFTIEQSFLQPNMKLTGNDNDSFEKKFIFHEKDFSILEIALPNINKMINEDDEYVLRNIIKAVSDVSGSVADYSASQEPKFLGLLESCAMIPRTIGQLTEDNFDLLAKAKRKHNATERMRTQNEKERTELTWQKLMSAEKLLEYSIEERLTRELVDIEDQSSCCEEVFDAEDLGPSSEKIESIVSQCLSKNVFELHFSESSTGYPCVVPEDLVRPKSHSIATYECHMCTATPFDRFSEFTAHIERHMADINWKESKQQRQSCTICGNVVLVSDLLEHISKHIDHSRCSICHQFVAHVDSEKHRDEHGEHFMCGVCGEVYRSKPGLRKHMTHHRTGSQYSCDECGRIFAGMEKMVRHISHQHRSIDPAYAECPYCLELIIDIKKHLFTTDACKFKCKVCLKVEKTVDLFRRHMEEHKGGHDGRSLTIHSRGRCFDCPVCKVRVLTIEKLKEHKLCHCADKMYSKHVRRAERAHCDLCGTTMPKSYLPFHSEKHDHFDRCLVCFKFVMRNSLADHIASHESDHVCNMCAERFSCGQKLADHRWSHARVANRPCTDCALSFRSELQRARHISLVHKRLDPEFVECYFCTELIRERLEYHLFDANYCLRRCKLCNQRFKDATDLLAHVSLDHADCTG